MTFRNGIVTPTIAVTDLKRAKEFYGTKLGLEEVGRVSPEGTHDEAVYRLGENNFVCLYERPTPSGSSATACSFEVEDVEGTVRDLQKKGVRFEEYDIPKMGIKTENGVATMGEMKSAWFTDPDGNILAIGNGLSLLKKGKVTVKH